MRDLNGNNNGTINDYSQTILIGNERTYRDSEIKKEETTLGKIAKEKVIEAIVGVVFTGVATIIKKCQTEGFFSSLESNMELILIFVMSTLFILGIGMLVIFVLDVLNLLPLLKKGSFVEMESKSEWLDKLADFFRNSENNSYKDIRNVGKCYKNIEGKIYKIKGKKCPLCETKPIGNMYLRYSNFSKEYFWECSQNQAHRVEFDYKKKI